MQSQRKFPASSRYAMEPKSASMAPHVNTRHLKWISPVPMQANKVLTRSLKMPNVILNQQRRSSANLLILREILNAKRMQLNPNSKPCDLLQAVEMVAQLLSMILEEYLSLVRSLHSSALIQVGKQQLHQRLALWQMQSLCAISTRRLPRSQLYAART